MPNWELIGALATIAVSLGWLPQIIEGHRTKSLHDLSWTMMAVFSTGSILWLAYGYHINDIFVITTNAIITSFLVILALMKAHYDHNKKKK